MNGETGRIPLPGNVEPADFVVHALLSGRTQPARHACSVCSTPLYPGDDAFLWELHDGREVLVCGSCDEKGRSS